MEQAAGFPRFHTVKHKIFPTDLKANQKENYNENKYLRTHLRILWGWGETCLEKRDFDQHKLIFLGKIVNIFLLLYFSLAVFTVASVHAPWGRTCLILSHAGLVGSRK